MFVAKKTETHTILKRRDGRYAVRDANKNPVLGDDKVKVLVDAGLLDVKLPEPEPEAPAEEEAAEAEASAEGEDEAKAEE